MPSSAPQPFSCPALFFFFVFLPEFFLTLAMSAAPYEGVLRARGSGRKALAYLILALCIFVAFKRAPALNFGCTDLCSWFFSAPCDVCIADETTSEFLGGLAKLCTLGCSGLWGGLLWEICKNLVAGRAVRCFMRDCVADGLMRFVYETTSEKVPVVHDLMTREHSLWKLAMHAVQGSETTPVYIVMNMPAEQAVQKLQQHKLITKNGYKRLPSPKNRHMIPRGGCVLQFYADAEYVRVWG